MKLVKGTTTLSAWTGEGATVVGFSHEGLVSGFITRPGSLPEPGSIHEMHMRVEFETDALGAFTRLSEYDGLHDEIGVLRERCEELSEDRQDVERELATRRGITFMDFFGAAPAKLTVEFQVEPVAETVNVEVPLEKL